MDPITSIRIKKDSTLAMLLAAQARNWQLFYMEQRDLMLRDGMALAQMRKLRVFDHEQHWFELEAAQECPLQNLDVILMRKDPPVDMEYIYITQILELAEKAGVFVVNRPSSLRDANEKLFISWFPHCCAPTLVSAEISVLREFLQQQGDIICKPLAGMGGLSIFRLRQDDPNSNVVFEMLTQRGTQLMMAQRYLPEISHGDKRILMIDGDPIPYALARIPAPGETRGNLAAGGRGVGVELTERDRWICQQVGPILKQKGLLFVGLDVIGNYLTEINVTSPTCIRELDKIYSLNIGGQLLDCVERCLVDQKRRVD